MTPGEDEKSLDEEENAQMLSGKEATQFRALAARGNYLALDRPDIQYAVKEICRGMANPTRGDLRKLRRLGRYLIGKSRVAMDFCFQGTCDDLSIFQGWP